MGLLNEKQVCDLSAMHHPLTPVFVFLSAVVPFIEEFDTVWEAHMQLLIPCTKCGRKFFPDRIEVHKRSCKGPQGGVKPQPPQPPAAAPAAAAIASSSTNPISATALANVEMLLSTPLAIRRQLHSQTDAVVIHQSPVHIPEEPDKSQSD